MSYKFESKRDELYFKNYNSLREAIEYASGNGDKILATVDAFLDTLARNNISVSAKYSRADQTPSENKDPQNETVRKYIENGCVGDLDLNNTPITSLPEGLTVGGDLKLFNTKITSLPEGLTVGGYLDLQSTPITSLPEGLSVGGSLDLFNTKITSLPEGLTVGGDLDLRYTPITSLPEGLTVSGRLYLSLTPITSLPEGLTVGGSLYLYNTPISKKSFYTKELLKSMLPNVKGEIHY